MKPILLETLEPVAFLVHPALSRYLTRIHPRPIVSHTDDVDPKGHLTGRLMARSKKPGEVSGISCRALQPLVAL